MILPELLDFEKQRPLLALKLQKLKRNIVRSLIGKEKTIIELSKETEFSIPTVTKVIQELIKAKIVFEKGKAKTGSGRRPVVYGIKPDSAFFMGVDVKRDSVSLSLQNLKFEPVHEIIQLPYKLEDNLEAFNVLCKIINEFVDGSGIPRRKILGVCVVLTGRVDPKKGYNNTFFCFKGVSLSGLIESKINIRVFIENDSRAMLYGEYCSNDTSKKKNVIYLNISWGFGIGIICNKNLYYGHSGYSGEFGHSPILDNEVVCECGKKGCIQTSISGETILRLFKQRIGEGRVSVITRRKQADEITMHDIIRSAVCDGDMLAIEVIEKIGRELGRYLSLLVNIFNPDMVIIGGDMAAAGPYIELPIESALHKYSLNLLLRDMALKISSLGNRAAIVGACHILKERVL